ncbi:hypothetical protein FOQG_18498 [Fusarium oxysporum f. sp. raphani 54005]|uniref:Secreted in xylem 14 n=1 Tax=Fusarium oxysporum f. sp. raphani 54005 TaxID=1089458 RepID=X0B3S9_FUSOX|nr:hypothetical protein FOQG_18498 [Fusarium oxysporum f. sp. raphani 54005]
MKFSLLSHCTILTLAAVAAADNWDSCHCVRIKSTQTPAYCATKAVCKTLGSGFGYSAGAGEGRGQVKQAMFCLDIGAPLTYLFHLVR